MSNSLAGMVNGVENELPVAVIENVNAFVEEVSAIDKAWDTVDEALLEYLSWTSYHLYHKVIDFWIRHAHCHFTENLNSTDDWERGLYHHRLLNFAKDIDAGFKVANHDCVYIFINNLVKYLGEYLENIENDYDTAAKRTIRRNVAELLTFDYYFAENRQKLVFHIWKKPKFNKNTDSKNYGQVFEMLSGGTWDIRSYNNGFRRKKVYPRFNFTSPRLGSGYSMANLFEVFCEEFEEKNLFECDSSNLDLCSFGKIFNRKCLEKGIGRSQIEEVWNEIKNDADLRNEIYSEFISEHIEYEDNLYRCGLTEEDWRKFHLTTEQNQRYEQLKKEFQSLDVDSKERHAAWKEMSILDREVDSWSYYLRLNFCTIDRDNHDTFHEAYLKMI